MALVLPKCVTLTNVKLNALYYLLVLIFGVGLAFRYLNLKQNSVIAVPSGQVTAWADGAHDKDRATLIETMASFNQTLCQNPHFYEYWWDEGGEWKQGPHKCAKLCPLSGPRPSATDFCVRPAETYIQEASDAVFFVTEFGERYMDTETEARHYFIPSTDALTLAFEYSFSIVDNGPFDSATSHTTLSGKMTNTYSSLKDVLTVLVETDEDGNYRVAANGITKPPAQVNLSVPQLMRLARRPLDVIQPEAGSNKRPGAMFPSGPLARMAGVELRVQLNCHKSVDHLSLDVESDWEGPVCTVEVRPAETWWAAKQVVEVIESDGSVRQRKYHGVRVRFSVSGSYRFFDFNKVWLNLASCIVFMSLPAKFMLFFCIYCLGHLSTMYKQAIYQRCNLLEQCAGMAARLLSISTSFAHLQDVYEPDNQGISREKLKERLLSIVSYRDNILDEGELDQLVNFCFHTLVSYHNWHGEEDIVRLRSLLGKRSVTQVKETLAENVNRISQKVHGELKSTIKKVRGDETVTIDDFTVAHASIEPFSFVSFLQLFDVDRKASCVEQIFMPRNIRTCREQPGEALVKCGGSGEFEDKGGSYESPSVWNRLCCCFGGQQTPALEGKTQISEPVQVVVGKRDRSPLRGEQEPSPEPAAITIDSKRPGGHSVPERMTMLETTLRQCQEQIADALKATTARLDKLESGLSTYKYEMASAKKKMDMLDALTGHAAEPSISSSSIGGAVPSMSSYGLMERRQARASPAAGPAADPSPTQLGRLRELKRASSAQAQGDPNLSRTFLSPRPASPDALPPLQYPGLSPLDIGGGAESQAKEKQGGKIKRLQRKTRATMRAIDQEEPDKLEQDQLREQGIFDERPTGGDIAASGSARHADMDTSLCSDREDLGHVVREPVTHSARPKHPQHGKRSSKTGLKEIRHIDEPEELKF